MLGIVAYQLFIFSEQRIEYIYGFSIKYLAFHRFLTILYNVTVLLVIISKVAVRLKSWNSISEVFYRKGYLYFMLKNIF